MCVLMIVWSSNLGDYRYSISTGCFCPAGTLELGDGCVTAEGCLQEQTVAKIDDDQECPNGKVYKECGTACPTTCANKDKLLGCPLVCVPGKHLYII